MSQKIILPKFNNKLEEQLNNLFHSSGLPLHFNKTGNKEFTNYQRISIIILFRRSGKSIRAFIEEDLSESKWISWLGLKKIPAKSTLHDWLKIFKMKTIRHLLRLLIPKKIELTSIDGTGFDSWQRSRHYEKRASEELGHLPHMPYAKADIFIDVKTLSILDFSLITYREHDVKVAERIFKRNKIKNVRGLGDGAYDSEKLHEIARANGIKFYAPIRKTNKRSLKRKRPKGKYRRECIEKPEDYGMRWMNETVNSTLKRTQINSLRSKKCYMKKREFGWHVILYNLKIKIKLSSAKGQQTFFYLILIICPFRTEQLFQIFLWISDIVFVEHIKYQDYYE